MFGRGNQGCYFKLLNIQMKLSSRQPDIAVWKLGKMCKSINLLLAYRLYLKPFEKMR